MLILVVREKEEKGEKVVSACQYCLVEKVILALGRNWDEGMVVTPYLALSNPIWVGSVPQVWDERDIFLKRGIYALE